jgi:3D (Asp-Asp-Asp) domain-containing protein
MGESPQGDFIMTKQLAYGLFLIIGIGIMGNLPAFGQKTDDQISPEEHLSGVLTIENNSLMAASPLPEPKVVRRISQVVVTAYSSTVFETDDTPHITALGTRTRDGIIANNLLPFGTRVRLPELYGNKIFVVEDRMNRRKGLYHFDIWFPSYGEAKNFGAQNTSLEVLAN